MPPFSSLTHVVRRRRFFPSFSPRRPPFNWLPNSYHLPSSPAAALFLLASHFSSSAKILLKSKDLQSLSRQGIHARDSRNILPDQATGLVAASQANFMRVIVESALGSDSKIGMELLCVVRALLKKIGRRILVGDRVLVSAVDWNDRRGVIDDLYERTSRIIDPPVANVDHQLLLFSMDQPKPDPFALTRFLVEAESSGIPFTLALNKAELVSNQALSSWDSKLHAWGYRPMFCSVERRSGLNLLQDILKERTTVILGPSGVGKSSLINCLRDKTVSKENERSHSEQTEHMKAWMEHQKIGLVSKKTGTGKHTTQQVSLLPLPGGGFMADTPGFNQPGLLKVTTRSLAEAFPEIKWLLREREPLGCTFGDCLHIGEPGCAVGSGWERYPYYFQLLDEIKVREEFQIRTIGTKREADVRYKIGEMGAKHTEPRLEPKKHRRVSRKQLNQSILNNENYDDLFEEYSPDDQKDDANICQNWPTK